MWRAYGITTCPDAGRYRAGHYVGIGIIEQRDRVATQDCRVDHEESTDWHIPQAERE